MNERQAVDWLREHVAQQLRDNPDGPTLLDAIDVAREITVRAKQETARQFWDVVARSHGPAPSAGPPP